MVRLEIRARRAHMIQTLPMVTLSLLVVLWSATLPEAVTFVRAAEEVSYIENAVRTVPEATSGPVEAVDMTEAEVIEGVEVMEIRPAGGREATVSGLEAATSAAGSTIRENRKVEPVRATGSATPNQSGYPSGYQRDVIAEVCGQSFDNVANVREKVMSYGIDRASFVETCVPDLLGIMWAESRFRPNAENVSRIEKSYGYFQINLDVHRSISREQANDLRWSAAWTVNRLVSYGYPRYRTHAVQCHNGCGAGNGYADSVKAASGRF